MCGSLADAVWRRYAERPRSNGGATEPGDEFRPADRSAAYRDSVSSSAADDRGLQDGATDAQLRARAASADRHKKVAADVDKLVALSNELKSDVDKTAKDELSLDVIKKAQAIEKLAQDVQNRLKN